MTRARSARVRRALVVVTVGAAVAGALDLGMRLRLRALPAARLEPAGELVLWSHRGYRGAGAAGNTLAALDAAVERGYTGVEVDVQHVEGRGIYVSYTPVAPGEEAGLLRLEAFLARHGTALYYWIDFKNLGPRNGSAAAEELARVLQDPALARRCIVESRWPHALAAVRRRVPDVHLLPIIHSHPALLPLARWVVGLFGFGAVSLDHTWIEPEVMRQFGHLTVYSYTVDDPTELDRLRALGVDVVLTDRLLPPARAGSAQERSASRQPARASTGSI